MCTTENHTIYHEFAMKLPKVSLKLCLKLGQLQPIPLHDLPISNSLVALRLGQGAKHPWVLMDLHPDIIDEALARGGNGSGHVAIRPCSLIASQPSAAHLCGTFCEWD